MYQIHSVMFLLCLVAMCLTNFIYFNVSELGPEIEESLPVTMVTNNKQRGVSRRTVRKIRVKVSNWCIRWKLLLAPYFLAIQTKFQCHYTEIFFHTSTCFLLPAFNEQMQISC
jgi:hypothetical protein